MSSRYVLSHYRRCRDAKCPVCAPVRELIRKGNVGVGWGGVLNNGDSSSMCGDITRQGGELRLSSLPLAVSKVRGTSIADRDRDARNMFPSPDQESHCPHAKRPKTEHSNGASPMETSYSISPTLAGSGSSSGVCGNKLGCGPQAAVFCQSVRNEDLLCTKLSDNLEGSIRDKVEERLKNLAKEKPEAEVRNLALFV